MRLTLEQLENAADEIGGESEYIASIIRTETPAPHVGDLPDGRPLILNERHWFYKLSGAYPVSKSFPHLSNSKPGGYCKGRDWIARQECEHKRLEEKMHIFGGVLKEPALKSISMGLFQVMGFNHNIIGYNSVLSMWEDANKVDDSIDLRWFLEFVKANKLDDEIRRKDSKGFARGYNGPNYAINKYDVKIDQNYAFFKRVGLDQFAASENIVKDINNVDKSPAYRRVMEEIAPDLLEIAGIIRKEFPEWS